MDTFGTGSKCPSQRDVHLIESNKGSKERQGPTLSVCFREVSVKRESTVLFAIFLCNAAMMHLGNNIFSELRG